MLLVEEPAGRLVAPRDDIATAPGVADDLMRAGEPGALDQARVLASILGAVAGIIASGALVGWLAGVSALTDWTSPGPRMKFNTALAVAPLAAGLLGIARSRSPRAWHHRLGWIPLGIGLMVGIQYVTGTSLVDELVVRYSGDGQTTDPGRVSLNGTAALILLGAALLCSSRWPSLGQTLSVAAATIGILGLLGYASDVPELYGPRSASSMALITAIALTAGGAGLALATAERGWMRGLMADSPGARLLRGLVPWSILLPAVLAFLRLGGERAGLFDAGVGTWLMAVGSMLLLTLALAVAARRLDRVEAARVAADAGWREEQARFATAVETLIDPFVLARPVEDTSGEISDFAFEYANPAAARDPQLAGAHLVGSRMLDLLPSTAESGLFEAYERVVRTGEAYAADGVEVPDPEGAAPRLIDARATSVHGRLVLTWHDVTEQTRVEQDARRTADLLQNIAENTSALVFVKDLEERYLLVNRAYAGTFGLDPADLVGLTAADFMPAESAAIVHANDAEVLRARRPVHRPESLPAHDGPRQFISVKFPLNDERGELYAIGGIATDITDLTRVERELRTLSAELEHRVAERTAQLEVANRELESFSYSVSHDLRAPLRAIDGFSRLVLEEHAANLSDDARGDLERVRAAAQRMARLIDELLKLSRLSRRPTEIRSLDLTVMAQDLVEELQADASGRSVEVEIEPGLEAEGDPVLVRTALQNLLANALKFTLHEEEPQIHVGARSDDGERVFYVRDNGAGFDMQFADRLFRPFERLHSDVEFAGTGVGLATVQRVVRRLGGRVWAEGEPGRGATFSFTLDPDRGDVDVPQEVPPWTGN